MDQGGRGGEANGKPLLAGRQTETQGDVGFAGVGIAERNDVLSGVDVFTTRLSGPLRSWNADL